MRQIGANRQVNKRKSKKNSTIQLRLPMELTSAAGAGCCLLLFFSDVTASEMLPDESISCTESLSSTIELPDRLENIATINETAIALTLSGEKQVWFPLSMKTDGELSFQLQSYITGEENWDNTTKFKYNKCNVTLEWEFFKKPDMWDSRFNFGGEVKGGFGHVNISIAENIKITPLDKKDGTWEKPANCSLNGDSTQRCSNGRSLVNVSMQNEDAKKNCTLTMSFDPSEFSIMREIPPPTTSTKALTTTAESGLSTASLSLIIAGSVLGLILLAICIVVLVVCLRKRRQRRGNYHGKTPVESVAADNKMETSNDLAAKTEPAVTTQTAANETTSVRVKKVFAKSADRNSSGGKKNSRKEKPSKSHTTESFEKQVAETMEVHLQQKMTENNASQDTAETKTHEV
ncbi:hypothetical protein Ddc_03819 [Ditylenchus destructor]|nr:hypothetical protein Ddc_03819 [Ditylenchus destructor]